ncbi:MAG: MFS transporter, partial [Comamonadaceae bacterium]
MLLALTTAFALSQSYRTVAAIMAPLLQADFGLSAQALGVFAGAFHFAFGALQLFMGIGIDLHGVRRTVLCAFPLAIVGAVLSALSTSFAMLVAGQVLVGIGCAPAFLVCTVFIARRFAADRFASVSGLTLGIGSIGMLLTGTPLAWLVEAESWRAGFWALAAASTLAWALIFWRVHEPATPSPPVKISVWRALRSYGALFGLPHTLGIVALACVTYAAFITLRGLWLGPLLIERHGFSLVQSGNVAVIVSV